MIFGADQYMNKITHYTVGATASWTVVMYASAGTSVFDSDVTGYVDLAFGDTTGTAITGDDYDITSVETNAMVIGATGLAVNLLVRCD